MQNFVLCMQILDSHLTTLYFIAFDLNILMGHQLKKVYVHLIEFRDFVGFSFFNLGESLGMYLGLLSLEYCQ